MTEEQAKALQDENARLKALLEHSKTQLEYDELQAENDKLKADLLFLSNRAESAGRCRFSSDRDTGMSSNSIVSIAYNHIKLQDQVLPSDESDLQACKNMWEKLPEFRKTANARKAMERAEQALKG